ncbi:hypothetical protein CK203_011823 [Vitis vinifera]|uniref:Uncharacterized protein n=1 Tax=Vitis vinifera TaxID=29760 RepID=A0A438JU24_VITVI|nr:hypothetical protein CK203_011823 [Vitis vinifera]
MSSSLLLMEPMGGSFGVSPSWLFRWVRMNVPHHGGDYGVTMRVNVLHHGVAMGSGRGAQVVAIGGLDLPGSSPVVPGYIDSVLVEALSLLLGPLNADVEEALMLKPGCVIQRFLLSIFLSPGGELSVVVRLPTVSFRWLDAIQNYPPLLPDERLREVVIPAKDIRTGCPDAPSDGFVSHGVLFLSLMVRRYFMFVMMTFGGSMVIATLLAAVRNRGDGTWAMAGLL